MTGTGNQAGYYRRDGRFVPVAGTGARQVREQGIVLLPSGRRRNGIGISPELPQCRSLGWNVVLLAIEAGLICWAHFDVGVSWAAIGLGLGGVTLVGAGLLAYVVLVGTPRAIRRHHALLLAHRASEEGGRGRLHEVVDSQSTSHAIAPSSVPSTTAGRSGVSRTR